jgi:hypothetical protein
MVAVAEAKTGRGAAMLKPVITMALLIAAVCFTGVPAWAGACLAEDPDYTQCVEYPKGTDETMIKSQCKEFHQKYLAKCPAPKHKYCVSGDEKTGRIFTWGNDVDVETCGSGTWHP